MNELIRIALLAFTEARMAQRAKGAVGRVSTTAIYAVGSAVAAVAILGCLMAALWLSVRPYVGAAGAALIVAAGIAVLWLFLFIFTRKTSAKPQATAPGIDGMPEALLKELQDLFEQHKGSALLAALVAGLMAGNTHHSSGDR